MSYLSGDESEAVKAYRDIASRLKAAPTANKSVCASSRQAFEERLIKGNTAQNSNQGLALPGFCKSSSAKHTEQRG